MNGKSGRVRSYSLPPESWSPGDPEPFSAPPSIHANRFDAPTLPDIQRDMRRREAMINNMPPGQQFVEQTPAHSRQGMIDMFGPTAGSIAEWIPGLSGIAGSDDALYAMGSGDPGRIAEEGTIAAANLFLPQIAGAAIRKASPGVKKALQGGRGVLTQLMNPKFGGSR